MTGHDEQKRADATAVLLKLLAGRDKSCAQARAALESRGFDEGGVNTALDYAARHGFLDDTRLAGKLARDGLSAGWVGEVLLARLTTKGLDEAVVRNAIDAAVAELEWKEPAAALALVQKRRLQGVKAARFLSSRGFSEDVVSRFL